MFKRKLSILIALLLLVSIFSIGCSKVPEEYTEGVKLDKSYPDDDMPLYDDAVVYYCDEDDEVITIKYGVEDDLEDVADFYKDHFEDNEIVLEDESDKSSRYVAEGSYKDFKFTVKVTEPSGEYEEQVFATVVKVDIEHVEEPQPAPLSERVIGFWRQESSTEGSETTQTYDEGKACEFLADGTLYIFVDFEYTTSVTWEVINENTVNLASEESDEDVTITFEQKDGEEYLTMTDSEGDYVFFKDSKDGFSMETSSSDTSGDIDLLDMDDEQLAQTLRENTWYYVSYVDEYGEAHSESTGAVMFYSDNTFLDIMNETTDTGSWYVLDGRLYYEYDDDTQSDWLIDIFASDETTFLCYNSNSTSAYWLYANKPMPTDDTETSDDSSFINYMSDTEMTNALSGKAFYNLFYLLADGTPEDMAYNVMTFNSDYTFEDSYEDESSTGTWEFYNGSLILTYNDGYISLDAAVSLDPETGTYYLYLADPDAEDCYYIYSTDQL